MFSTHQCACKTGYGTQCLRFVHGSNAFCWQHQNCTLRLQSTSILSPKQIPITSPNKISNPIISPISSLISNSSITLPVSSLISNVSISPVKQIPMIPLISPIKQTSSRIRGNNQELFDFKVVIPDIVQQVNSTLKVDYFVINIINRIMNNILANFNTSMSLQDVIQLVPQIFNNHLVPHIMSQITKYIEHYESYKNIYYTILNTYTNDAVRLALTAILEFITSEIIIAASYIAAKNQHDIINAIDLELGIKSNASLAELMYTNI